MRRGAAGVKLRMGLLRIPRRPVSGLWIFPLRSMNAGLPTFPGGRLSGRRDLILLFRIRLFRGGVVVRGSSTAFFPPIWAREIILETIWSYRGLSERCRLPSICRRSFLFSGSMMIILSAHRISLIPTGRDRFRPRSISNPSLGTSRYCRGGCVALKGERLIFILCGQYQRLPESGNGLDVKMGGLNHTGTLCFKGRRLSNRKAHGTPHIWHPARFFEICNDCKFSWILSMVSILIKA